MTAFLYTFIPIFGEKRLVSFADGSCAIAKEPFAGGELECCAVLIVILNVEIAAIGSDVRVACAY